MEEEKLNQVESIEEDYKAPEEIEEKSNVESFRLQDYSLVATVARNGVVIKYDFLPKEEATLKAKEVFNNAV